MVAALNKLKISFKQAFVVVMAASMLCALILSWIVSSSLTSIQQGKNSTNLYTVYENEYSNEEIVIKEVDHKSYEFFMTLNTWTPLVLFFFSTVLASFLFYRWKMKTPLAILNASIHKINSKQLDFNIDYDTQDEMGELIHTFESMRKELYTSFTTQWRAQEESKILNAAFAHDIRTPLTVLKGQVDVLIRNVKLDRVNQQQIIETLSLLASHISRIENYTDEMSKLQRLDEICILKKDFVWNSFWRMMQKDLEKLAETGGKTIHFDGKVNTNFVSMDASVITRILENIVSNAVRYATSSVIMHIESTENLVIKVYDDGPGFTTKALQHALEPFYHEDSPDSLHSSGLGLFICKTLIEKHGGSIVLSNEELGGGCVTLMFFSVFKN